MEYGTVEEREAIERLLRMQREASRSRSPEEAAAGYSEDADWMNAFGVRRRGRVEIEAWLRRLFADSGYQAGSVTRLTPDEIRFIRPDVAVVHRYQEFSGQRTPAGEEMSIRRVHHWQVVTKEEGQWKIVNHVIMDERT